MNNIFLGQTEDQVCAGPLSVLLCVQLGFGTDSEHIFKLLKPLLLATLQDPTAKIPARASVSEISIAPFYEHWIAVMKWTIWDSKIL